MVLFSFPLLCCFLHLNELTIVQKLIGFLGCGVLSVGLVVLLVASCREQLLAVLERFSRLNAFARVMACGAVAMLALYGGAKHYMPTNTPPDDVSSPTNDVEKVGGGFPERGSGVLAACQEGGIPYSNRLDSASSLTGRLEVAHGALFCTSISTGEATAKRPLGSSEDAASPL